MSKPSAIPKGALTRKLIQRIWGGCERLAGGDVEQGRAEEGEHERDQLEHHEADVLVEVRVELAALLDGVDDRCEVVVGEDHSPGVLRDLGTAAHGDADVGGLDRRSVVDAVAGHRDDVALLLQRLGEEHLVLGSDAADDADRVDPVESLLLGESGEVGAEDRLAGDAELLGDRGAGDDVVPCDHPHADVRRLRVGNGRLRLLARRVDHGHEARHLELLHVAEQVAVRIEARDVEVAEGGGHHAQAGLLHPLHVLLGPLLEIVVPGDALAVGARGRHATHHRGRRTLDEAAHDVVAGASLAWLKVAISLYVGSNGSVARRGSCSRVASIDSPALCASTRSAPSVGSPTTLPSTAWSGCATNIGRIASWIVLELPAA